MTDDEKLIAYAISSGEPDHWWFSDPNFTHNRQAALSIIDSCLQLGVPVTDMVTSQAWLKLITKVTDLEHRIESK